MSHGFYVWAAYGMAALLMMIEPWLALRRRRRALREAAHAEVLE